MPVDDEPLTALLPDQAPDAKHEAAFAASHFSVELVPFATVLGVASRLTLGAVDSMDTVTDWLTLARAPAQVKV